MPDHSRFSSVITASTSNWCRSDNHWWCHIAIIVHDLTWFRLSAEKEMIPTSCQDLTTWNKPIRLRSDSWDADSPNLHVLIWSQPKLMLHYLCRWERDASLPNVWGTKRQLMKENCCVWSPSKSFNKTIAKLRVCLIRCFDNWTFVNVWFS